MESLFPLPNTALFHQRPGNLGLLRGDTVEAGSPPLRVSAHNTQCRGMGIECLVTAGDPYRLSTASFNCRMAFSRVERGQAAFRRMNPVRLRPKV